MNENVPSLEAIAADFKRFCEPQMSCQGCQLFDEDGKIPCAVRFTHTIMCGGKIAKPVPPEPKPEPKLPAWCKVGQWVTDACPDENEVNGIHMIVGLSEDGSVAHVKDGDGREYFANVVGLKPIRFREYTFEEARKLLGKVIEYAVLDENDMDNGHRTCEIVTSVYSGDGDGPLINCDRFCNFVKGKATIDGVPIGVPEVDEVVMGGAE